MEHLGDRRRRVRFEVVGALPGALEVIARARVVDLSRFGMLLTMEVAPAIDSRLMLRLHLGGGGFDVETRVRHFRPIANPDAQYFVGLEFVTSSPSLRHAIEDFVSTESV